MHFLSDGQSCVWSSVREKRWRGWLPNQPAICHSHLAVWRWCGNGQSWIQNQVSWFCADVMSYVDSKCASANQQVWSCGWMDLETSVIPPAACPRHNIVTEFCVLKDSSLPPESLGLSLLLLALVLFSASQNVKIGLIFDEIPRYRLNVRLRVCWRL